MADRIDHDDLVALTAFVDGEASAAERARIAGRLGTDPAFARAHATLARLKACVGDLADDAVPVPARPGYRRWLWPAAGAAATAALLLLLPIDPPPHRRADARTESPTAITLSGSPALVPDLGSAGLRLVEVRLVDGTTPAVVANYRGPRGCRVVLRIDSTPGRPAAEESANRWMWTSHGLAYQLTAFGMPADRFAMIAGAARLATLDPAGAAPVERLLRQARAGAPPCVA